MSREMELIGITGGIGAGKSVVSRILRLKGFAVYDCDSRARLIMERSENIRRELTGRLGAESLMEDGTLNRGHIACRIFGDKDCRDWLNALVHSEVRRDLGEWMKGHETCFVESAILHTSKLDRLCSRIWLVEAPENLRIRRALRRGGISETDLRKRIDSQRREFQSLPPEKTARIFNDGERSLLTALDFLLGEVGLDKECNN